MNYRGYSIKPHNCIVLIKQNRDASVSLSSLPSLHLGLYKKLHLKESRNPNQVHIMSPKTTHTEIPQLLLGNEYPILLINNTLNNNEWNRMHRP